jgi:hypothetical protein
MWLNYILMMLAAADEGGGLIIKDGLNNTDP